MNIAPFAPTLSTPTVANPPTDNLRRDNNRREVITPVTGANPSAAEKGVASDKDRAKTPAQNNEQLDFANLRKQAELSAGKVSDKNSEQNPDDKEQDPEHKHTDASQHPDDKKNAEDIEAEATAEEKVIRQLASRDQEVRAHESAHASVGGATTGAPSYSFDVGPDGKKYAVDGEVSVDLSVIAGNPQATIKKMQQVHAAALAPANPSSQDIRVAANATKIILEAQSELLANEPDNGNVSKNNAINISNSRLSEDANPSTTRDDFDTLINQTLNSQEAIAPNTQSLSSGDVRSTQTVEVQQRAQRVQSFYHTVSQGYERPEKYQFELTA